MLRKLTGLSIDQQPSLALLNDFPFRWPCLLKHLVFVLLAAKTGTAGAWKTPSVFFRRMKYKVLWIMIHERVASIINDRQSPFESTWEPWATYIHIPLSQTANVEGSLSFSCPASSPQLIQISLPLLLDVSKSSGLFSFSAFFSLIYCAGL